MMVFNKSARIDDLVTCVICHELFEDPRLLPCSHTYCRKCIDKMAAFNNDEFRCPLNDGFQILRANIGLLPVDRAIFDLVQLYTSAQRSSLCTNCHSVLANYTCDTCRNETFCGECYQKEHSTRLMQKHQRVPIEHSLSEKIHCELHPKKELEYWCYKCLKLVCIDCLLFNHKDHRFAMKDDVAKEFEKEIHNHLQGIQSSVDYKVAQTETLINAVDNEFNSFVSKIKEAMQLLREMINSHEESILQRIMTVEKQQRKQIEEYKTPLDNELHNLSIQKATFDIILSNNNLTKLLLKKQEFDNYVYRTGETLKSLSPPPRTEYRLEGIDLLENLRRNIELYGQFVEITPHRNPQLERMLLDSRMKQKLDLAGRRLTDLDMKLVAKELRENTMKECILNAEHQE